MKASMQSKDFNRLMEAVKAFVSTNNTRVLYQFIQLKFCAAESQVTAIAVDGYRMAVETAECHCDEDFTAYIQGGIKLPRGKDVFFQISGRDLMVRCENAIFGCVQPEGEFLDWAAVLTKEDPVFKIAFNPSYLISDLQAAKASVGSSREPVILEFYGKDLPAILRTGKKKENIKLVLPFRTYS